MMGWFGPKLEPGERAVVTCSFFRYGRLLRAALLLLAGYFVYEFAADLGAGDRLGAGLALFFAGVLAWTARGHGKTNWLVIVTNRRLLLNSLNDNRECEAVPLAGLRVVSAGGVGQVIVEHGQREISIPTDSARDDERVLAAIARAKAAVQ